MDTASFEFVLFGLVVALVSNWRRTVVWRSSVLFVASVAFPGLVSPHALLWLPFIGFLLLGYAGLWFVRRGGSRFVSFGVIAIAGVYVWLKRYTFLPSALFLDFPFLTLGLSYIFFRVIHLLVEAGESDVARHVGFGEYLLYMLNFTTFVAGPIQRYEDFARDEFARDAVELSPATVAEQLERIVRGLFKVSVLATLLHAIQQDAILRIVHAAPLAVKLVSGVELALVYPLFLYSNFSGYIDIVIALARLMRVRLPENFDRPFSASSAIEFWSRWHMTLSNWFKTYVYNPMLVGLMRRVSGEALQPMLAVLCFFVTFFLIGTWHGRTTEFVVFGLLTGAGVSVNKLWQVWLTRIMGRKRYSSLAKNGVYVAVSRGLTFVWFAFELFWFWGSWTELARICGALSIGHWLAVWLTNWFIATVCLATWERARSGLGLIEGLLRNRYARVGCATAMLFASFVLGVLLKAPAPGIVYKQF